MRFSTSLAPVMASFLALSACAGGPDASDLAARPCHQQTAKTAPSDRTWVKSSQEIYLEEDGKIFKTRFDSDKLEILADHDFAYVSSFRLSQDSAYIAYTGYSAQAGFNSYVYDVRRQQDNWLGGQINPEFSPDGKSLAWTMEDKAMRERTIAILDLQTKSTRQINYPLDPNIKNYRITRVAWSLDSTSIYIGTIAFPDGQYARYDLATGQLSPIEGRFHPFHDQRDMHDAGLHYIEGGREVPVFKAACPQWQCANQGAPMPGVSAMIDKQYRLVVALPSGEQLVVAQGGYNQCEGATIQILSWVQNGKYLTYRVGGTVYIYGLVERRMSPLFTGGVEFGWNDSDERHLIPAYE